MGGKERKMEGKWLEETRERVEEEWKRRRQRLRWRRGGGEQGPGQEDEGWGARFHTNSQRPLLLTVFLSEDERTLLR